ncbi:hypothetical protein AB8S08_00565 [Pseudidiomarina sp. PP-1MA]|uniref:NACHT domain-containing protein n=1 Tax=Pseudidiomarina sp. PP-1MA TaxID=3237706 RepID=A0AB39X8Q3_9GAMM
MSQSARNVDNVRVSRAGHTFHERWTARRALQLVIPQDDLFAIVIEGLSPRERIDFGQEAADIADLTLFYGHGDTFESCRIQEIIQFKYKANREPVTSSYLKKTLKKFAATLRELRHSVSEETILKKLSFAFVTNAKFSDDLWEAIACVLSSSQPKTKSAKKQLEYLNAWCNEENIEARALFPLIEFRASTQDLPAHNRALRRLISDWSVGSSGLAAKRLHSLVELVRERAQIEGQNNNSIRREDVLDALECDEEQLFPADTRFVDVGDVIERVALNNIKNEIKINNLPIFLYADGGVGKTVFIQSLATHMLDSFEVVVFDCFGGGAYRSEAQARHLPKVGLLQIINELSTRGLCDPLLPTDSDQYGLIDAARKRLKQASETIQKQSTMQGILIVLDAADNAQLEADARGEVAFPKLLLASLSSEPIDGVRLLLTGRPEHNRMDSVIGTSKVKRIKLEPFSVEEVQRFIETRRAHITNVEFSTILSRSKGNARVLQYLVESWDTNVSGNAPQSEVSVNELIAERCQKILSDLYIAGWNESEVRIFFAALGLLPPPIPLTELARALDWSDSQVNSAASDLAPMLELVKHGVIFRDEPTETYIKEHFAYEVSAQQSIAQRLQEQQRNSIYAAEALPHFLVVIGDSDRAYKLAGSDEFPSEIPSEHERRRLHLARLYAAFLLATRSQDMDRILSLSMQLSQVSSANARGDEFIGKSPGLATILGGSDVTRRLFNDRSGWRGARDSRLIVAFCFSDELNEARIHHHRAIGWINWYLRSDNETKSIERSGPEAVDIAAVMFLNVLENDFSSFNRNIQMWHDNFALSVISELISLCAQHQAANGSEALQTLTAFSKSKKCLSLTLQLGLLSRNYGLAKSQIRDITRATCTLSQRYKKKLTEDYLDYEMRMQSTIAGAAIGSLLMHSNQSAKKLLRLYRHHRPSSYDYHDPHRMKRVWVPILTACIKAWSSGERLSFHYLIPKEVKTGRKTKLIASEADLRVFLDSLIVTRNHSPTRKGRKFKKHKQFSPYEQEDILKGTACILRLVNPIEAQLLSKTALSNDVFAAFLAVWKSELRPNVDWQSDKGLDNIVRHVGIGFAKILLHHCESIEMSEAKELINITEENKFSVGDKLALLSHIARRANLNELAGEYAAKISQYIVKDDYIEQRSDAYRELAEALIPMSIDEAQMYYSEGLAQLDQMGGSDYDLIYSVLNYAAEQPGGFVKPELSHRLMNLCQIIFQDEPSKFGWTLFARASAASIGLPALYKLIRWNDQDIVDYSYALPQLVCYLAKAGHLDPRRASVLLTICKDHGWHQWQVGDGLLDILSVADHSDKASIFSLITEKLENEHCYGGWEGLWKSLLKCLDKYENISKEGTYHRIQNHLDEAIGRRKVETAEHNIETPIIQYSTKTTNKIQDELAREKALANIVTNYSFTSTSSFDEAIQQLQHFTKPSFGNTNRLLEELIKACPYNERVKFLESICESTELELDRILDLLIECVGTWSNSSAHLSNSLTKLINKLFSFKGSQLFGLSYSSVSRQIYRLSELCGDSKFVLKTVLDTVAKERLEPSGEEWLQIASSLSCHTKPATAVKALEELLSSSAAQVGDEIGEGLYRPEFAANFNEGQVFSDIVWHLLGDSDAYIRWSVARSLKGILDVGLTEDIERLLDLFDTEENLSLASENQYFSFMNAQQWLLMGLSRAALHHGEKLRPLKDRILELAKRPEIHVLNKLHLTRCLSHIGETKSDNRELAQLWLEIDVPPHGITKNDGIPSHQDRKYDFDFDYEFTKYKISNLGSLFGTSKNVANDLVAKEILKRWPQANNMSYFPGKPRYRVDDRFETYREHIQRHARLHAATTMVKIMPVVQRSYDWEEHDPWKEFLKIEDVSFEDGSWLSDHKDRVPKEARLKLLRKSEGSQQALLDTETLFSMIGFSKITEDHFLPICGSWKSPDGVYINISAAIIKTRGAVGQCASFSKSPDHELWLPRFSSNGRSDPMSKRDSITPLIWEPEPYPVGIDENDEWATRYALARPRLGATISRLLKLTPSNDERFWYDNMGELVLKSGVWGGWRYSSSNRERRVQDDGTILWAKYDRLDQLLKSSKRSLIFTIQFTKTNSDYNYDNSSGIREIYIGLKRVGEPPRFWFAKKASKIGC